MRATCKLGERWRNAFRRHAIELGRAARRIEPAGIFMPDSPHVPRQLAILLGQREVIGHAGLPHQDAQVGPRVHAFNCAVNPQNKHGKHTYSFADRGITKEDMVPYFSDYLRVHPVAGGAAA